MDHRVRLAAVPPGVWHPRQRRCSDDLADPKYHRSSPVRGPPFSETVLLEELAKRF
ncbi:hypothetical protein [Ktedonobacter sp. SOSP1-52]|uniref:hypothetical protein n=1 Tax=Ktedonobacter sp. SOSP1-52 TaxID=2778366 RepID=UPI0019160F79|nr:hypothetical protein [Ktedonobacter sp. SOSP1-52]